MPEETHVLREVDEAEGSSKSVPEENARLIALYQKQTKGYDQSRIFAGYALHERGQPSARQASQRHPHPSSLATFFCAGRRHPYRTKRTRKKSVIPSRTIKVWGCPPSSFYSAAAGGKTTLQQPWVSNAPH